MTVMRLYEMWNDWDALDSVCLYIPRIKKTDTYPQFLAIPDKTMILDVASFGKENGVVYIDLV